MTNNGSHDVSGYGIDAASGALSELGGSPFETGMNPLGIAIPPPSNEFSFGKVRKQRRKGKARLFVEVPGPGVIELAGNAVKARTKQIAPAGRAATSAGAAAASQRLSVAPRGKAKRRLRKRGRARVKVKATYTPDGGTTNTKSKRLRLVKRR